MSAVQVPLEAARAVMVMRRKRLDQIARADPWRQTARPEQLAPEGDWTTWLLMAGRGFGKTRSAAEFIREEIMAGRMKRVAFVGRTAADVRDVMVEGPSGILAAFRAYGYNPRYRKSLRRIDFHTGAVAFCYSADKPDLLRGPEHDGFWADEIAAWENPAAWDNLMFGLRIGERPRGVAGTTPRPVSLVRGLVADVARGAVHLTRGRTVDNAANLARSFLDKIIAKYQGTRLGRQELEGELLDDVEGAFWDWKMIGDARVERDDLEWVKGPDHSDEHPHLIPHLQRIVVAIDPATTHGPKSDYTAIVAAGMGWDGELYVLESVALKTRPNLWGRAAWDMFDRWAADAFIPEVNQGGEMVTEVLENTRDGRSMPAVDTVHAKRGKKLRAEPVVTVYEQRRVHHLGDHKMLEDQMVVFPVVQAEDDETHDDLVDANVYALLDLLKYAESTGSYTFGGG